MEKQAAKFAMHLLNAATVAHILHLQSRSYAQHKALGSFYEELPDLVDAVVEQYQGRYGILNTYPAEAIQVSKDPVQFMQELSSFVATYRDFCDESHIQNDIDAIASLIDGTLYKLKFLS